MATAVAPRGRSASTRDARHQSADGPSAAERVASTLGEVNAPARWSTARTGPIADPKMVKEHRKTAGSAIAAITASGPQLREDIHVVAACQGELIDCRRTHRYRGSDRGASKRTEGGLSH